MVSFREGVLLPGQRAQEFIAEIGGLPEISRAAEDLQAAIGQTREEIGAASFAERFPRTPSDYFSVMLDRTTVTPAVREAVVREGEAGLKRAVLAARLNGIEGGLNLLLTHLVELRADLEISQTEF